jgi:fatty-acyl-CoA synthase
VRSTMGVHSLNLALVLRHGARVFAESEVVTDRDGSRDSASFAEIEERARYLAGGMRELGIDIGDRVATLAWNTQEHLEAYWAVPCMGAVLHTVNMRLSDADLVDVLRRGGARVLLVDAELADRVAALREDLPAVTHVVVMGTPSGSSGELTYDEVVSTSAPALWSEIPESAPAVMCFTSGTTGAPKGVVYSHRSMVLHTFAVCSGNAYALTAGDRVLTVVPMFHANAWGLPHAAWFAGADIVLPGRDLSAERLVHTIALERPTVSSGVPTVWADLLQHVRAHGGDLSSFRLVVGGGSAVAPSLIRGYADLGVRLVQGWGMTETSPLAAIAPTTDPPEGEFDLDRRMRTGRVLGGVELRITGQDGLELPWDDVSTGEIEVRGPWVTETYLGDSAPERFRDGWLRTGDVARVSTDGYIAITDRTKDLIKSGGEWISSAELEMAISEHEEVLDVAVIGIPDDRWQERPLAIVVPKRAEAPPTPSDLTDLLQTRVARWWIPQQWRIVTALPRTTTGKTDKKALRAAFEDGSL